MLARLARKAGLTDCVPFPFPNRDPVGFASGLLGIGGGTVVTPFLAVLTGMPQVGRPPRLGSAAKRPAGSPALRLGGAPQLGCATRLL